MKNIRGWSVVGLALVSLSLVSCGGDSSSSGQIRLVNATLTHPSLDLVRTSDTVTLASGVSADNVSEYVGVGSSGSTSLQITDTGGSTTGVTTNATVPDGKHYSLIAYESNGAVKTTQIAEDTTTPTTGASLRVISLGLDAGALYVYVTDPNEVLSSASTKFVINESTAAQQVGTLSFKAGDYRIRVTGQNSTTDIRADMLATLADQELAAIVLTPTTGGILLNSSILIQQGAYSATRNTNARVRLLAATTPGGSYATLKADLGATSIASAAAAPSLGTYILVPSTDATFSVTSNGATIAGPSAPAVGTDSTLMVYGGSGTALPTVTLIADDNHLPTASTTTTANVKIRLVNAYTTDPLSLTADNFPVTTSDIGLGSASGYTVVAGDTSMDLQVDPGSIFSTATPDTNVSSGVWSVFMVQGTGGAAQGVLRRDR